MRDGKPTGALAALRGILAPELEGLERRVSALEAKLGGNVLEVLRKLNAATRNLADRVELLERRERWLGFHAQLDAELGPLIETAAIEPGEVDDV